jgi:hypothetical protein
MGWAVHRGNCCKSNPIQARLRMTRTILTPTARNGVMQHSADYSNPLWQIHKHQIMAGSLFPPTIQRFSTRPAMLV